MPHARSAWLGALIVVIAAALFGSLGVTARFAYDMGMEPFAFVAWRAGVGAVGLFLVMAIVRRPRRIVADLRATDPRAARWLALAIVLGAALNLAAFLSFDNTTVALALLGFYTYPAMVAVVGLVSGRETLDRPRALALALALGGMAAVVASQLDPAAGIRLDVLGIGLALGAALSQTVYVTVSRDGYHEVPTEQAILLVLLVTTIGASALALLVDGPASLLAPLADPSVLPLLLFTGAFAAAIPSLGFLSGIRSIGGLRAGILMLWEPVVGVALAAVLLDEGIVPVQVLGALGILAAAVILQRAAAADHARHVRAARNAEPDEDESLVVPAGTYPSG
jgi:DME family drug/metabolite transporter